MILTLLENPIVRLYINLIGWALLGFILGKKLPASTSKYLGQFLYWIGVPLGIIAFMRGVDISGYIWISPIAGWVAILVGAIFARFWMELEISDERIKAIASGMVDPRHVKPDQPIPETAWTQPTQGSFLLAMMVGNTSYLGFPVVLSLIGPEYFLWAVLYNTLATSPGLHGIGYMISANYGNNPLAQRRKSPLQIIFGNPALWSFGFGFFFRHVPLPDLAENGLRTSAWSIVTLAIIMIGIQLSQLGKLQKLSQALICLAIKMIVVPLVVGTGLMFLGVTGLPRLAIVLQMAMPPSIATVIYAIAYGLDKDLSVATVALGSVGLLMTIPMWLWLFAP